MAFYTADKRNIVKFVADTLRSQLGCPVFEHFKWMSEINDFPTLCIHIETDYKSHVEASPNVVGGDFNMYIRGYVRSEDVVSAGDELIQRIETVIDSINAVNAIQIDDIHINSLEHDEGLFEPFGIVTVNVDISYRHADLE